MPANTYQYYIPENLDEINKRNWPQKWLSYFRAIQNLHPATS